MKVVRAGLGDVPEVVALERETMGAPHWSEREYVRAVEAKEDEPRRCLMVVRDNEELVGFAVGSVIAGVGELESVAVRDSARRRGVGRILCEALVSWAWELGVGFIELEVRAGSVGAQRLYASLGFRECGRRRGYYSEPADEAVLMRLERPPAGAAL